MAHPLRSCWTMSAAAAALLPFGSSAFDGTATIVSQGINRDFIYHAPGDVVEDGLPLVFVFHGLGSNMYEVQYQSGFDGVADANDFIVVYPMATLIGGDIQWNMWADDVPGHAGVGVPDATDDVIFTDDMIDWFCANHHVDPARIYSTGFSNGGDFTYLLSLQRPGKFAAFAPASADLHGDESYMSEMLGNSFTPVAIYHVHGDPDSVVEYPDVAHDPTQPTWPLSDYGGANCGVTQYTLANITTNVDRLTWCDGSAPNGRRVEMIRVAGLDHNWAIVDGYNASEAMWAFMSTYSITSPTFSCVTGVGVLDPGVPLTLRTFVEDGFLLFSRPLAPGTVIRVVDASGRTVVNGANSGNDRVAVPGAQAGIYRVEVQEAGRVRMVLPIIVL